MKKIAITSAVVVAAFAFSVSPAFAGGNGQVIAPKNMNFGVDFDWNNQSVAQGTGIGNVQSQSGVSDMMNVWSSATVQTDGCPGGCGTGSFSMGFDSNQQAGNQVLSSAEGANATSGAMSGTSGFGAFGGFITFPAFGK